MSSFISCLGALISPEGEKDPTKVETCGSDGKDRMKTETRQDI